MYSLSPYLDDNDDVCDVPNPITWPVNVYLADHTVEDRLLQSNNDVDKIANEKIHAMLASNDRTSVEPILLETSTTERNEFTERANRVRRPKPHQPRFETKIAT